MKKHNLSLNYLHVFLIFLVVAFHSLIAYEAYIPVNTSPFTTRPYFWAIFPILDIQRSVGFTLFIVFNDHFFMPLLFFISGLFVWKSLTEKGPIAYLQGRFVRLGIPFVMIKLFIIPFSYYPAYLNSGATPGLLDFIKTWATLTSHPSGPVWFLSLLLLFDILVTISYKIAPGWGDAFARRLSPVFERPAVFFILIASVSTIGYLTMTSLFDRYHWINTPLLHFQTTRFPVYMIYMITGIAVGLHGLDRGFFTRDGLLSRKWTSWLFSTAIFYIALMIFIGKHLTNPSSGIFKFLYGACYSFFCASCCMFLIGLFVRIIRKQSGILDSLHENSYGIFLLHYFFVIWLQYLLLQINLHVLIKGFTATVGSFTLSWLTTSAIRRIPAVSSIISPSDSRLNSINADGNVNLPINKSYIEI